MLIGLETKKTEIEGEEVQLLAKLGCVLRSSSAHSPPQGLRSINNTLQSEPDFIRRLRSVALNV